MKPYSITKVKENLTSSQEQVSKFKSDSVSKGITAINSLIERNSLVGIETVEYSYALLQDVVLANGELSKEDRLVKYKLLNQLGLEILDVITKEYAQEGYRINNESGNIKIYLKET